MNKLKLIGFLIIFLFSTKGLCQYVKKMTLEIPYTKEIKATADSLYLVSPEFTMTGLVVKIDTSGSFLNSYIIADNDTIYLNSDEHVTDTSGYKTSNLIVFKNKLSEFHFYPGNIKKEAEFSFINASPSKKVLKGKGEKKKCRLFRTRND
ncbi:MAG: hypothetical protein JSV22_02150 [Bacteroidales bacterium]|nr:MAG: hypothetical protein JSV22_02150 [Bacteroidales bacterium]